MSFQAPLFLLALVAVPVLVALYVGGERRGRAAREAYAAPGLLPALTPRRAGWRRHAVPAVYAGALVVLVGALARPATIEAVAVEQASVVVATDRSGSMQATDVAPSRLIAARRAAQSFVDAVPADVRVGAIAFNQDATVLQSPTRDHAAVRAALGTVTAAGSTATGDALARALGLLREARVPGSSTPAPGAIVLLSDGKSVRGRDALAVAEEAAKAKVPVYTVALGTAQGTIPSSDGSGSRAVPPDPATLAQVAERTGGRSFEVADAAQLDQVFRDLGSHVATEERPRELSGMAAGGALLLLLGGIGASQRWFGRMI